MFLFQSGFLLSYGCLLCQSLPVHSLALLQFSLDALTLGSEMFTSQRLPTVTTSWLPIDGFEAIQALLTFIPECLFTGDIALQVVQLVSKRGNLLRQKMRLCFDILEQCFLPAQGLLGLCKVLRRLLPVCACLSKLL